jgi:hypothetical protein
MKHKIAFESGKTLFYLNLLGSFYFSHLIVLSYLDIDTRATSIIRESLTVLFLLFGMVIIVNTFKVVRSENYCIHSYSFWAFVLMILNISMITFVTFFHY